MEGSVDAGAKRVSEMPISAAKGMEAAGRSLGGASGV